MLLNQNPDTIRYILTNMDDAVCLTNKQGVLLYANPAAEALLGLSRNLNEVKKIWEVIPFVERNDGLIQLFIEAVQQQKTSWRMLVDYENNDGQVFQVRVCLTYSEDDSGCFVIIFNDLTDFLKVSSAFTRYTSPQIADYVLHTPEGEHQGGQRREVTVLMSDLRGFTALSAALPPEQLVDMLNHYFEKMTRIIDGCQGVVIEFLGDGIFVVFGAPKDDAEHAAHAVACAIGMQNAMDEVNDWNRQQGYPALSMGIAIHSGAAVVGNIGSNEKMKYGCVGETVNLAGRIESLSVGGQILISEYTCRQIRQPLLSLSVQKCLPKGARDPIFVYEIAGLGETCFLRHRQQDLHWQVLADPREVVFYRLNDRKSVEETPLPARITALSADRRFALLQTDTALDSFQNIMIDIGEKLYGKITGNRDGCSILCFTGKPDGFAAWAEGLAFLPHALGPRTD